MLGRSLVCFLTVSVAGCELMAGSPAPDSCLFPPDTMVTRVGRSPVAALGLAERGVESQDPPGGTVYVTNDPVERLGGRGTFRQWCVVYDVEDAPGARFHTGPVPDGWTPPDA